MIVYFSILLVCSMIMFFTRFNTGDEKKILGICFGIIWAMISLQQGWGGDFYSYFRDYESIKSLSFSEIFTDESLHGEAGYKLVTWLFPSYQLSFAFGMAIYCIALAFFFYHFVPRKMWWLCLVFFAIDRPIFMGAIASFLRMAVANACLIFGYYFIVNEKRLYYALVIILGAFFHTSVLMMLPFVFVKPKQFTKSPFVILGCMFIITVLSMIFPSTWINTIDTVLNSFDTFGDYARQLEELDLSNNESKGITLLIEFLWGFFLAKAVCKPDFTKEEYLALYFAIFRVLFDLLPGFGLSVRVYYYVDYIFLAGIMVALNKEQNQVLKAGVLLGLFLIIFFVKFLNFAGSDFYQDRWNFYNLIF